VRAILDYLSLIRAANCVIAAGAVWVGAWLTGFDLPILRVLLSSASAFLVCAAGNLLNDVVDLPIDRINRPERALVRQVVSVPRAKLLVVVFNLVAIAISMSVSWQVWVVVTISAVLLFAYNLYLKRVALMGNFVVALLSALTFIVGGMAVEVRLIPALPGPLVPAAFALLFHLVREIVKDVEDLEGDRTAGVTTLAHRIGPARAMTWALGLFVVLVLLTLVPVYFDWFGRLYEIITVYIVDLPLLAILIIVWGIRPPGCCESGRMRSRQACCSEWWL
jgi:geranylgeranylglycerol-phosphate geranylgeranyltransferase